jgi:hypothetical protein
MLLGIERRHNLGHLHFITFSCYRGLPYLNEDRARVVSEETPENLGWWSTHSWTVSIN